MNLNHPALSKNLIRQAARIPVLALLVSAICLAGTLAQAAVFDKADNSDALNLAASWTNNAVPGSGDTAQWDSAVTALNTTNALGGATTWAGINIFDPGSPVTIVNDGNTLTLGAGGIDMSQASQSLTVSNTVSLSVAQPWQIGNNQTLNVDGALTTGAGAAVRFEFDNSGAAAFVATNVPGTVIKTNNMVLLNGPVGNGLDNGVVIGTINDTDFAALNQNNQIVGGSSLSGLYLPNPNNSAAPTIGSGTIYDIINTNSYGVRIASTYYVQGMRFNTPQPNKSGSDVFTYNGVGSWEVLFKSGNTFDLNTILMTTNLGSSYVVFGAGGYLRIADALNEFLVYQNNPGANLVMQSPIINVSGESDSISKLGIGTMEIQANSSYSGGTLIQGGTVLIDGAGTAGTGPVTVYNGANFEGQSGATNFAPVTVNNGGSNSVLVATANGKFLNNTNLTFNAGTTWLQFIYSNSIVPSSTTAALLVSNTLTASNTVNINVLCPNLSVGQFPLVKYTTLVTDSAGSAFPFNLVGLQPHVLAYLSNNVANSSIDLVVTNASAEPIHWAAGSGTWDIGVTPNWVDALGNATTYQQAFGLGDNVLFNDSASGPSPVVVTLNENPTPGSVVVSNNAIAYTITGSGSIAGAAAITKTGPGTLVMGTVNNFTGGININGGILNFNTLLNLGAGSINFGGGTLQYNGNADDISVRTISLNPGGGTIDTAGQSINFANHIGAGTGGGLTKTGAGSLTLNGTNLYTGNTVVNEGTLALGASSYVASSAAIVVAAGAVLDTASSGVNLSLNSLNDQILAGNGTVDGTVTAPAGTTISPATNGVYGTLSLGSDLTISGATLAFDISTTNSDLLTVAGNLTINSGSLLVITNTTPLTDGVYKLISYSGSLLSGTGSSANLTLAGFSQAGAAATLSDATPGEIDLIVSASASDSLTWAGTGGSWDLAGTQDWLLGGATAWAYTNGDFVRFDDTGAASTTVSLEAAVQPGSVIVSNNAVSQYVFADGTGVGGGKISGNTSLVKDGPSTLILQTANTYTGPTTIANGTLQVGNGGIGDIGTGNVTNNGALIFSQGDGNVHTVSGQISGTGSILQQGSSTVVLAQNNSYTGPTTISSGALQIGTGGATGSLGAGVVTNNGTLLLNRSGTISVANNISGSGALAKLGTAAATFTGNLAYQGNTYISNGVVKMTANDQIPNASSVAGSTGWLILDGGASAAGTVDMAGFNETVNALSGVFGTVNGLITNSGTATTTTNILTVLGDAATTYNGVINGNGSGSQLALVLLGTNTLDMTGVSTYSGGTFVGGGATLGFGPGASLGAGSITLSNGTTFYLNNNGATASFPGNDIVIPDGATASLNSGQLGNGYDGDISGGMTSTNVIVGPLSFGNSDDEQYSNFLGTVLIPAGGTLRFSSTGLILNGSDKATFEVEGTGVLETRNAGTVHLGALQGNGNITNPQANSGTGVFQIGFNNASSTYSGFITGTNTIIKVGTGTLTLTSGAITNITTPDGFNYYTNVSYTNIALSYVGATTISNGVLKLVVPDVLTNWPTPITLASATAVLDGSQMGYISNLFASDGVTVTNQSLVTNGVFEVVPDQSLSGIGTILASKVLLDAGSTFNVGLPTGLLTANNNVEIAGAVNMSLNGTNTPNSSELAAQSFTIDGTATLVVTNAGPNIINGTTFHLFNQAVTGLSSVLPLTDPTGASTYVWNNQIATDGSITLVSGGVNPVNETPTNIVASVSGNTLTLSWPADHLGWVLSMQTNSLAVGLSTNWVDVPGSASVTSTNITLTQTNGAVFFRMHYP